MLTGGNAHKKNEHQPKSTGFRGERKKEQENVFKENYKINMLLIVWPFY